MYRDWKPINTKPPRMFLPIIACSKKGAVEIIEKDQHGNFDKSKLVDPDDEWILWMRKPEPPKNIKT